jgi:succinyl-CoA synthetase beta subunit
MASATGGIDIEQLAEEHPEKIERVHIDPSSGFQPFLGREVAAALSLENARQRQVAELIAAALYRMFVEEDCSLAEINPLVITDEGKLLALDAKITFDDNALYRQPDIAALRDFDEEDPLEVQAHQQGIQNYVKLDGNIGCVVNGAGLAMATMDAIKLAGGDPANFLDIGTVNDETRVVNAFRLLVADRQVKAILINIFGGMARVDVIAQGVITAMRELRDDVAVVTRLAGTNLDEGLRLLAESSLPVLLADDLGDAARKSVIAAAKAAR